MSRMYKYANLIRKQTPYAENMQRLSNQIFGEVARPTTRRSMRVVQLYSDEPYDKRVDYAAFYPRLPETNRLMRKLREYGLFRDEHEDFREEMIRLRTLRGKGPVIKEKKSKKIE